jgi:hypothetical protein
MSASKTSEATPVTLCADSAAKAISSDSQTIKRYVTRPNGVGLRAMSASRPFRSPLRIRSGDRTKSIRDQTGTCHLVCDWSANPSQSDIPRHRWHDRFEQFLAGSGRPRRLRVSNFAQTLSSHASRNYFNAILRLPKCGSIRPFDKGSDISV